MGSESIFFNAQHAPIGAHSSFTLGCKGRKGGLGIEMPRPAEQNVYVGMEVAEGGFFEALPFWSDGADEAARFDHMKSGGAGSRLVVPFADASIGRDYRPGRDIWTAGDLKMEIISPLMSAPDPETSSADEQRFAYCPAVLVELTVDNRRGRVARRVFFGYEDGGSDALITTDSPFGFGAGRSTAVVTDASCVSRGRGFTAEAILSEKSAENADFALGRTGLLLFSVAAGEQASFRIALAFFRSGLVTTGLECSYWYTRFFKSPVEAAGFALSRFDDYRRAAEATGRALDSDRLNRFQRFHLAHSVNSYYGSTQLLDCGGRPVWVVNEGEYRMMNTMDLTVDQLFFELKMNPWTVANELDLFVDRYSYVDRLHEPGTAEAAYEGGISFTHDMGVRNGFTPPRRSSYELGGLDGCFSQMTHEQLVNWILCSALYIKRTGKRRWESVLADCLKSMLNRDNPDPAKRDGIMGFESSRTLGGAEITTYDSLDSSLGQARANAYLALKCFAAYLALAELLPEEDAATARLQAQRVAARIAEAAREGVIPALLDGSCSSGIIPAIEGLVFPWALGLWGQMESYGELLAALRTHFDNIMKPGICLYPDGGWKLSSTADNSWLSKIYLCQFVARELLGSRDVCTGESADRAHFDWLHKPENLYWAWSDQMTGGVAKGSKYYPRGVTSVLWLEEAGS